MKKFAPMIVARITTRVVVGRTPGTVTAVKRLTVPAPSTSAASYSSSGMFCRAARYSST